VALIVVVPEEAPLFLPITMVVAAPPKLIAVAPVLNIEAVPVSVVVMDGLTPFNAKFPLEVMAPVKVEAPSTVSVPLAWIFPVLEIVAPEPPPV
jgi:hypothetical protein